MTVYVADTFRGTGSIHNSPPEDKHASVGNWTIYPVGAWNPGPPEEDSQQIFRRSAGGLSAHYGGWADTSLALVRVGSAPVPYGVGVFVAEAKFWGEGMLSVDNAGIIAARDGYFTHQLWADGYHVINDTGPRPMSLSSTLRIEVDPAAAQVRAYLDNVLMRTASTSGATQVTRVQLLFPDWDALIGDYPTPTLICDYINARLNTVSGPLGSPAPAVVPQGAAYPLPKLIVDGRVFLRGNGDVLLPALTFNGGERTGATVIWDKLVRCRERR
jgi:hypothetical protein